MKVMAFDAETSIGKTIHGPTFRDPNNDVYTQIWASHPDHVEVLHKTEGFKRVLAPIISDVDKLVGHNISFDLCYFWGTDKIQRWVQHGGKLWDCQLVDYILTGQQHTTASLAELQVKYLGAQVKPSRITYLFKKGIGADRILSKQNSCPRLFKLYHEYCKSDGATPLLIFKQQYIRAKRQGMLAIVELYNDYILAIINMTCTGVEIDVKKAEQLLREFMLKHYTYLKEAQDILASVWTDSRLPEFNINSPDHKSAVLFGGNIKVRERVYIGMTKPTPVYEEIVTDMSIEVEYYDEMREQYYTKKEPLIKRKRIGYTEPVAKYKNQESFVYVRGFQLPRELTRAAKKEGLYSTDDKVMSEIKSSPKTPKEVLKYCELQELAMKYKKAAKTYCQAFIDRSIEIDGRHILYPHFNSTITPTGRITSSEPNLQNVPSKGDLAASLMGLIVAPKGWVCLAIDFSQLEKWTQALVSQDVNLIEALEKGVCMHCMTLAKLEGLDYNWVYQKAKIDKDVEWDNKRTAIKPVGFLMDYGGMPKRVAKETGMVLEQVEEIYRIDKEMYPDKHKFFEQTLPAIVASTATISLAENIAQSKRKGKDGVQLLGKAELLPIFDNSGNVEYNKQELRRVGYWQTNYGKKYHFTDTGRKDKNDNIRRSFSLPKFKNYPNQGGGADIQGATTAELLPYLITNKDRIRMINEIHDSKLFYVREDALVEVAKYLKDTIEDVPAIFARRFGVNIPFKFPVEIKIGADFGNMGVYKIGENSNDN